MVALVRGPEEVLVGELGLAVLVVGEQVARLTRFFIPLEVDDGAQVAVCQGASDERPRVISSCVERIVG